MQDKGKQDSTKKVSHGIALVELLAYIDEARMDENVVPVFKLADLGIHKSTRKLVTVFADQCKQDQLVYLLGEAYHTLGNQQAGGHHKRFSSSVHLPMGHQSPSPL